MFNVYIFILFITTCFHCANAQGEEKYNNINIGINNNLQELYEDEKEIIVKFEEYLNNIDTINYHSPDSWSNEEKEKYWFPDIEIIYIANQTKLFTEYSPILLNIQKKDSIYFIKIAFISTKKSLQSIFNVLAKKDKLGKIKFYRYQDYYTRYWKSIQVGSINFYYEDSKHFNYYDAQRSSNFSDSLAILFNTQTFQSKYYIFKNTEELLRAKGYEYTTLMYNTIQQSAENDINNRIISSGEGSAYDPHEITHTYLNQVYWNTLSDFVNEGIATFLGGNIEKSKNKELHNLKKYLNDHKDLNLNNVISIKNKSEGSTNIMYALSSFICSKVYEKHGINGLKELCLAGTSDSDVYRILEKLIQIKRNNLDEYLRNEIKNAK